METYKEAKERLLELRKLLNLYDILHLFGGVPYKDVHFYMPPNYASGYNMGEVIVVKCNGVTLDTIDNRKFYAKSCKWRPKHGHIVLNFTKKALREYIEICHKLAVESDIKKSIESLEVKRILIKDAIDLNSSDIKKKGSATC